MKPGSFQQTIIAVIIALAVIITVVAGLFMASPDEQEPALLPALSPTSSPVGILLLPTFTTAPPRATLPPLPGASPTAAMLPTTRTVTLSPATAIRASGTPGSATPALSATACQTHPGWQVYRVQPGDTLFDIGMRYGLTVTTLMDGNCLTSTTLITDQTLYVPPVTPMMVIFPTLDPAITPTTTPTHTATDGACTSPDSIITTPKVGAVLQGMTVIKGTARNPNFASYRIEIRQEGTSQPYVDLFVGKTPVAAGQLADLDTTLRPNGEYWLRLTVLDSAGTYPERCAILVAFINP